MAKRGRPPTYSEEERDEIIAYVLVQVATGRFVSRVFREDATTDNGIKLPHVATFWAWMLLHDEDGELDDKLTRARERGAEALIDETIDIADEALHDTIEVKDDNGNVLYEKPNKEWMARSRLRVDTRLKLAAMLKPRKYGAKLDLTSGGKSFDPSVLAAANERARKYRTSEEANHDDDDKLE